MCSNLCFRILYGFVVVALVINLAEATLFRGKEHPSIDAEEEVLKTRSKDTKQHEAKMNQRQLLSSVAKRLTEKRNTAAAKENMRGLEQEQNRLPLRFKIKENHKNSQDASRFNPLKKSHLNKPLDTQLQRSDLPKNLSSWKLRLPVHRHSALRLKSGKGKKRRRYLQVGSQRKQENNGFVYVFAKPACPSKTEWQKLNFSRDEYNTPLRVLQPPEIDHFQWFLTTKCDEDYIKSTPASCQGCCRAVDHTQFWSQCRQQTTLVEAFVQEIEPGPSGEINRPHYRFIHVDGRCECNVLPRDYDQLLTAR